MSDMSDVVSDVLSANVHRIENAVNSGDMKLALLETEALAGALYVYNNRGRLSFEQRYVYNRVLIDYSNIIGFTY